MSTNIGHETDVERSAGLLLQLILALGFVTMLVLRGVRKLVRS